jgi:hypothetical protein
MALSRREYVLVAFPSESRTDKRCRTLTAAAAALSQRIELTLRSLQDERQTLFVK